MKIIAKSSLCVKYLDNVLSIAQNDTHRAIEWDLNYIPPTLSIVRKKRLISTIIKNKLKIRYHLPYSFVEIGHSDSSIREFSILVTKQYLDFIHSIQGAFAVIHIGYYEDCTMQKCLAGLQEVAYYAKQLGITLCIENLMQGITTNIEYLVEMLLIDNVFLCLDTGHAYMVNQTNDKYILGLLSMMAKIKHSHVYFSEDSSYNHIPFSKETLYNSKIMQALAKSQCDWFTMELDNFEEQELQKSILVPFLNQYSL